MALTNTGSKVNALVLIAVFIAVDAGYWILTPKMTNELVSTVHQTSLLTPLGRSQTSTESTIPISATTAASATTQQGVWNVLSDGSLDLVREDGKIAGDLAQPYVDLAKVSYSFSNGSLYFRFDLRGKIPNETVTGHVTSIWYQTLFDVDSDPSTGFPWSSDYTPDYILQLYVEFGGSSKTPNVYSYVLRYSGTGSDWSWTPIRTTERFGNDATLAGGIGQDFFILTCEYEDISLFKGSVVQFFVRSGILYDGKVYNDPVPDKGTVKIAL